MANHVINNTKLGLFVTAGLLLLVLSLYMIGRNSNFFGHNFRLHARFDNVQGLTAGNNVRYAGIQIGTVKKVTILSDTLIEVTLLIQEKMKSFIHKNDIASIGTDGLMGNKLINISPARDNSPLAEENDILAGKRIASTEEMLETLNTTNLNLALISEEIRQTVQRVNNSHALWEILEEPSLPAHLRTAAMNIRNATGKAGELAADLQIIVSDLKAGKGSLGSIVRDTALASNLNEAVTEITKVGTYAQQLTGELTTLSQDVKQNINNGKGTVNLVLKDSVLASRLSNTVLQIEQGTEAFHQNMEALKHNFLLRGYFRRQEKRLKKTGSPDP